MEKLFKLNEHHTDVKTEVIAGVTTFMTMAYILAVHPNMLAEAGMDKGCLLYTSKRNQRYDRMEAFSAVSDTDSFCETADLDTGLFYGFLELDENCRNNPRGTAGCLLYTSRHNFSINFIKELLSV